jgi:limonene-1,2-epoxide hydrolase
MSASGFEFTRRLDVSHASPHAAKLLTAYFDAKSSHDPEGTTDYYRKPATAHVDVPLGWAFDGWDSIYSMFSTYMPQWPGEAVSAPTRIVGGDRGAIVFFTNSAGMFGDSEIQSVGVVSLEDSKIVRWADYWDARHFGIANFESLRTPDAQYPADFRETLALESSEPAFAKLVARFTTAVKDRDWTLLSSLLAPRVTFTDHPAHLYLAGKPMLSRFLQSATDLLPYTRREARQSLVVGGEHGGGYEWTAANSRDRGVITLALDPSSGLVTAIDAMWNGALASDEQLSSISRQAVEH